MTLTISSFRCLFSYFILLYKLILRSNIPKHRKRKENSISQLQHAVTTIRRYFSVSRAGRSWCSSVLVVYARWIAFMTETFCFVTLLLFKLFNILPRLVQVVTPQKSASMPKYIYIRTIYR